MTLDQENREALAVYAQRITTLEAALRAVIEAWAAPHYGDTDAHLDHIFTPIEVARKIL